MYMKIGHLKAVSLLSSGIFGEEMSGWESQVKLLD